MESSDAPANTPADQALVRRACMGEMAAWDELINRYERPVYSLAMRILRQAQDAEDVTQQTFISVMENLQGFRAEAKFSTWIMRIAANAAIKVIRKRQGMKTVSMDAGASPDDEGRPLVPPEYIADWKDVPEQLVRSHEVQELLEEALDQLDEKYRVVFILRDVEGLSVRETAEMIGQSESNTKVRLLRARLQLREQLTRALGNPEAVFEPHRH